MITTNILIANKFEQIIKYRVLSRDRQEKLWLPQFSLPIADNIPASVPVPTTMLLDFTKLTVHPHSNNGGGNYLWKVDGC